MFLPSTFHFMTISHNPNRYPNPRIPKDTFVIFPRETYFLGFFFGFIVLQGLLYHVHEPHPICPTSSLGTSLLTLTLTLISLTTLA